MIGMTYVNLHVLIESVRIATGLACLMERDRESHDHLRYSLERVHAHCRELELDMTALAIEAFQRECLSEGNTLPTTEVLLEAINQIMIRLHDEVSLRRFVYVDPDTQRRLDEKAPFGDRVWRVFPDAIRDAEEASKCLAFRRATASVFHCLRVIDLGIRTLIHGWDGGPEFLAKRERRVWLHLIRRIRSEADKSDHVIARLWSGRQARLGEIAEKLSLVAEASRNPTMHAETMYTPEEALDVFNTTGAFMRRLAEELDPKAHADRDAQHSKEGNHSDREAGGRVP